MPSVLHVGCGRQRLPDLFEGHDEVRLDIDPACNPDVVASMIDMGAIGPFDRLYCSHALEHLAPLDCQRALAEFRRVMAPDGLALMIVPDLEDIRPTDEIVYVSSAGPITGRDMYWGLGRILDDEPHMAHKNGFVADTLRKALQDAGFSKVWVSRDEAFQLVAVAKK